MATPRLTDDHFILDGCDKRALVIVVGMDGSLFGYEDKYLKIAEAANDQYGYTVFGFRNPASNWDIRDNGFPSVMRTVSENMAEGYEVSYFGFSAGASFAMFHAWEFPQIKRMLLVNPPLMVNTPKALKGIKAFDGESTLIIGERDQSITLGRLIERDQKTSGFSRVIIFPKADHRFTGMIAEFISLPFTYLFSEEEKVYVPSV